MTFMRAPKLMLNSNRRLMQSPKKQKALRREYYYAKQGFKITTPRGLRFSRCGSGRGCGSRGGRASGVLGCRQIALDLILAHVEHHYFVGSHSGGAPHVKLDRLSSGFVFLLDGAIISKNCDRIPGLFLVGLIQSHLDWANTLGSLAFLDGKLVVVAVATAPQLFQVVAVVRNQAAHHAHVAGGPFKFAFGGLQVCSGAFNILFSATYFGSHGKDFLLAFLFDLSKLGSQLLIRSLLILTNGFGTAARLRQLGAGHTDFLLGDFQVALEVGQSRVSLLQLRGQDFVLLLLMRQVLLQPRLLRMPHVGKNRQPGEEHYKQYGDPAGRAWTLVVVGFLWAWYVWRNTHS